MGYSFPVIIHAYESLHFSITIGGCSLFDNQKPIFFTFINFKLISLVKDRQR